MSTDQTPTIADEIRNWPGIAVRGTRSQFEEFAVGEIELGHLHGTSVAHLPVSQLLRQELIAAGRATPHPVVPESDWIEYVAREPGNTGEIVALFRTNYEQAIGDAR